jgi:hypothetical protein
MELLAAVSGGPSSVMSWRSKVAAICARSGDAQRVAGPSCSTAMDDRQ